jgi:hypothetical protein
LYAFCTSSARGKRVVVIGAGSLAGPSSRFTGDPPKRHTIARSEAMVFVHGFAGGCVVLTRNLRHLHLMKQVIPNG